mmetsp:Transcript_30581/g.61650  ORF Transcript_30581/g.61650 Transcript_30581/m.61650 type:complete len:216 (+) Transcript_30581:1082-1729(+)
MRTAPLNPGSVMRISGCVSRRKSTTRSCWCRTASLKGVLANLSLRCTSARRSTSSFTSFRCPSDDATCSAVRLLESDELTGRSPRTRREHLSTSPSAAACISRPTRCLRRRLLRAVILSFIVEPTSASSASDASPSFPYPEVPKSCSSSSPSFPASPSPSDFLLSASSALCTSFDTTELPPRRLPDRRELPALPRVSTTSSDAMALLPMVSSSAG